jgi:hypothetical protein
MAVTAADVRNVVFSKPPMGSGATTRTRWTPSSTSWAPSWLG